MGRAKDEWIEKTGGFRIGEPLAVFRARLAEIVRLENDLKSGKVRGLQVEKVCRRLCDLKGIDYDGYYPPDD
jgi:hypothetical protein